MRALFLLTLMSSLSPPLALAQNLPDYRPDGTISICGAEPTQPWFDGCANDSGVGWPAENGQLRRTPTPPKTVSNAKGLRQEWIEVTFDYFAPSYPGCSGLSNFKIGNQTIDEYLRSGSDPGVLRHRLGNNSSCIRNGRGWVAMDRIRPFQPLRRREAARKPPAGSKDSRVCYEHLPELAELRRLTNEVLDRKMSAVDLILPHVGKCVMSPQAFAKKDWGSRRYSVYDTVFTDFWNAQPTPDIVVDGYKFTKSDLRAIDGIARTLMGEAEGCQYQSARQDFNPGHFETLGRIMIDRAAGVRENDPDNVRDYGHPGHRDWHELEQVISKNNQFNNWDSIKERWVGPPKQRRRIIEDNGALQNTLCPKNDLNSEAHRGKGGRLDPDNQELWKMAVEVAVQMYGSGGRRYQEVYPWKIGGQSRPYDRIEYYTHGVDRSCGFIRVMSSGVRDFQMDFPGGACPQLKLWRPASNIERRACNEAERKNQPRPITYAAATPPHGKANMSSPPARATASQARADSAQSALPPQPSIQSSTRAVTPAAKPAPQPAKAPAAKPTPPRARPASQRPAIPREPPASQRQAPPKEPPLSQKYMNRGG